MSDNHSRVKRWNIIYNEMHQNTIKLTKMSHWSHVEIHTLTEASLYEKRTKKIIELLMMKFNSNVCRGKAISLQINGAIER